MDIEDGSAFSRKKRRKTAEDGTYLLRSLVMNIPLAPEKGLPAPRINCVELWGQLSISSLSRDSRA